MEVTRIVDNGDLGIRESQRQAGVGRRGRSPRMTEARIRASWARSTVTVWAAELRFRAAVPRHDLDLKGERFSFVAGVSWTTRLTVAVWAVVDVDRRRCGG